MWTILLLYPRGHLSRLWKGARSLEDALGIKRQWPWFHQVTPETSGSSSRINKRLEFPTFTHLCILSKTVTHNFTHAHVMLFLTSVPLCICQENLESSPHWLISTFPLRLSLGITSRKVLLLLWVRCLPCHPVRTPSFIQHSTFSTCFYVSPLHGCEFPVGRVVPFISVSLASSCLAQ